MAFADENRVASTKSMPALAPRSANQESPFSHINDAARDLAFFEERFMGFAAEMLGSQGDDANKDGRELRGGTLGDLRTTADVMRERIGRMSARLEQLSKQLP